MTRNGINIGLRLTILFILAFALLGYPPELALVYGAVGGVAGGVVGAWWLAKDTAGQLSEGDALSPFTKAQQRLLAWRERRRQTIKQRSRPARRQRRRGKAPPKPSSPTPETEETPETSDASEE